MSFLCLLCLFSTKFSHCDHFSAFFIIILLICETANVGTGVRDFFYEPINGAVHGPRQFIEGELLLLFFLSFGYLVMYKQILAVTRLCVRASFGRFSLLILSRRCFISYHIDLTLICFGHLGQALRRALSP